jgi:hypothetical protein
MKIIVKARPIYHMVIPLAMLKIIMRVGESHYDGTCKNACRPGGFVWGWHGMMEFAESERKPGTHFDPDIPMCSGDFRAFDLVLKILEMARYSIDRNDNASWELIYDFEASIKRAFQATEIASAQWRLLVS